MARYPAAEWRRVPGDEPAITPTTVIFHTMVGTLPGVDAYFRSGASGGIESHFGVGGPWEGASYDGLVYQWRDTAEQADANYKANAFAVSIETSDGGDPTRPWTPAQVDALVALGRWLADTHNIPKRICPAWDAGGFGWHVMFGAPGPWTPVAKTCPGSTRIAQLKDVVLPAIFADQPPEEPDMTDEQARQLDAVYRGLITTGTTTIDQTVDLLFARVRTVEANVAPTNAALAQLGAQVAELTQLVKGLVLGDLGDVDLVGKFTGTAHVTTPVPPLPVAGVQTDAT